MSTVPSVLSLRLGLICLFCSPYLLLLSETFASLQRARAFSYSRSTFHSSLQLLFFNSGLLTFCVALLRRATKLRCLCRALSFHSILFFFFGIFSCLFFCLPPVAASQSRTCCPFILHGSCDLPLLNLKWFLLLMHVRASSNLLL